MEKIIIIISVILIACLLLIGSYYQGVTISIPKHYESYDAVNYTVTEQGLHEYYESNGDVESGLNYWDYDEGRR